MRALGIGFRWSNSGYGPLGTGPDANSFVHRCELSDPGHRPDDPDRGRAAGSVELTRYADPAGLQEAVARFRAQTDTPVQDNEVTRLRSGRYAVDALRRWYPTNPQGCYQALVVDEGQRATLLLEVNSLSRADFEAGSAQRVADALADFLERSHAAPVATRPPLPDWAGSFWEDAQNRFRMPIAHGWRHDPADGRMEEETALPRFRSGDGSATVIVLPTGVPDPEPLPAVVDRARAVYTTRAGAAVLSEEPMALDDGTPAHRFDLRLPNGKRMVSVLVAADHVVFQINGVAPADRWEGAQPDMLRMARSFTAR